MTYTFQTRECDSAACRFRFPLVIDSQAGDLCPACGATTQPVTPPYSNYAETDASQSNGTKLVALLDNLRSALNVGTIIRSADGAGLAHTYLCGTTATPKHAKVAKTALGAHKTVPWSYHRNGMQIATELKEAGYQLWALEKTRDSAELFTTPKPHATQPAVLIVGNELAGVDSGILAICDQVVHLPMRGSKTSLNVAVAFGIATYLLTS
jgi:tRNA G18 (ribose-2'-O)-methylase SpoU